MPVRSQLRQSGGRSGHAVLQAHEEAKNGNNHKTLKISAEAFRSLHVAQQILCAVRHLHSICRHVPGQTFAQSDKREVQDSHLHRQPAHRARGVQPSTGPSLL